MSVEGRPHARALLEHVSRYAITAPDRVAVAMADGSASVTYAQLDARSNQLHRAKKVVARALEQVVVEDRPWCDRLDAATPSKDAHVLRGNDHQRAARSLGRRRRDQQSQGSRAARSLNRASGEARDRR